MEARDTRLDAAGRDGVQLIDDRPVYSATDLVGFLACGHLMDLERSALARLVARPHRPDPELDRIRARGYEHEARYRDHLVAEGRRVTDLSQAGNAWEDDRADRHRAWADTTRQAIERGDDVIFQGCFFDGTWLGFADFLLRVERPTPRLPWSYEVADTKLARSAKASALIQLCSYNEQLATIQGAEAEQTYLVLGGARRQTQAFRVADFGPYYRAIRRRFEAAAVAPLPTTYPPPDPSYPHPAEHCEICRWDEVCRARRRADDDLALVAGIAGRTRTELMERGVATRQALAVLPLPVSPRLDRTGADALERVREQARIQVEGEDAGRPLHELLAPARLEDGSFDPTKGLASLPEPRPGDLFLDLEGDPFALAEGVDYLFGILEPGLADERGQPTFHAFWSRDEDGRVTEAAEQRAFERAVDLIIDRLDRDPAIHVYHYAAYEPTAFGRLMGRYGTREEEVDRLLRGKILVDLYRVVRQGLRASVESYSIKRLEPFYGYVREVELRDAGSSIVAFETWLELGGESGADDGTLERIARYNRDDVESTFLLRDWLEDRRRELEERLAVSIPRPEVRDGTATESLSERLAEIRRIAEGLTADVPEGREARTDEQHARWLLAQLLEWHRREDKPGWWRQFHLMEALTDEERMDEPEPLAMLELIGPKGDTGRRFRYRFPPQEHDVGERGGVDPATGKDLPVEQVDDERGEVVLRFPRGREIVHPTSLVPELVIGTGVLQGSLRRIGESVLTAGIDGDGPYRAARDLLLRRPPRISGHPAGDALRAEGRTAQEAAHWLVRHLDRSYLAIQGPPGSGKTWTGARMILDLVAEGRRVGVTANSHKVIGKLLDDVHVAALADPRFAERPVRIGQRPGGEKAPTCTAARSLASSAATREALDATELDVVGGTAWLWSDERLADSVDVLFVDEAGQFALANAIAVSQAAGSLVLLGDPQQLDQPTQGTHPDGAARSALAHLLDDAAIMPAHLGLFMERTWRLHPDICRFTSDAFYRGQLEPHPDNERQRLHGAGILDGTGVRFVPVAHVASRNDTDSPEEAEWVAELVAELLAADATWTDSKGRTMPLVPEDILIVAPYNLHRRRIRFCLEARGEPAARVPVGTVDKFQGQQAPVSIYSMATSRPEDAPRGMEFLYSLNRLNVATSRARCVTLVVASPALVMARVRSPRQMALASALCRFVEMAEGRG